MIRRLQLEIAEELLFKNKALIIFGPRQVGKTTFTELLLSRCNSSVLKLNGDDFDTRELLVKPNARMLKNLIGNKEILFIDEAQRIENIGILMKIIVDQLRDIQIIATGSSSFDLAGKINEPLTGRKYEMMLFQLSFSEMAKEFGFLEEKRNLNQRLVYGSYPEIVVKPQEAESLIKLLSDSYLYKDILLLDNLKKPQLLQKLIKALALQVGNEVSVNEIGNLLKASNKTIEKYLQLLEDTFVIFIQTSFSKNVRNELSKSRKIYFYDNGILNAAKGNFNPMHNRDDQGSLWENYLMSERRKYLNIKNISAEKYFWRTSQQQEIDYIEIVNGKMKAFEFKWKKKNVRFPKTFLRAYPDAEIKVIDQDNYHEFIGDF